MSLIRNANIYVSQVVDDVVRETNSTWLTFQEFMKPPFGPLNGFHDRLQSQAKPLSLDPVALWWYTTAWWIPLITMCWLLVGKSKRTRFLRMCLAATGLSLMYKGYTSYRFYDPKWNALANILGMFYLHIAVRYVEFALIAGPIVDPHMALGRPRWVAALDLCMNHRMLYLGSVGMDTANGPANSSLLGKPPKVERHLIHKRQGYRPTSRFRAVTRHLSKAFLLYAALDTMYALLRWYGPSTFGPVGGASVLLSKEFPTVPGSYAERVRFIAMPYLWNGGFLVPKFIVRTLVSLGIPFSIWGGLSFWYHVGAVVALSGGMWEVEVWDVDFFDAPLRATSLIDLWGKRWHSAFRHHFAIMAITLLTLLQIPVNSITIFPTTFLFSGLYHAIPELAISPAPRFWDVVAMFYLTGLGCVAEVLFKRFTGRQVGGPLGWIWTWLFQANVGFLAANAWLDAGYAACSLFPDNGIGDYLAPLLLPFFAVRLE